MKSATKLEAALPPPPQLTDLPLIACRAILDKASLPLKHLNKYK